MMSRPARDLRFWAWTPLLHQLGKYRFHARVLRLLLRIPAEVVEPLVEEPADGVGAGEHHQLGLREPSAGEQVDEGVWVEPGRERSMVSAILGVVPSRWPAGTGYWAREARTVASRAVNAMMSGAGNDGGALGFEDLLGFVDDVEALEGAAVRRGVLLNGPSLTSLLQEEGCIATLKTAQHNSLVYKWFQLIVYQQIPIHIGNIIVGKATSHRIADGILIP